MPKMTKEEYREILINEIKNGEHNEFKVEKINLDSSYYSNLKVKIIYVYL